MPTDNLTLTPAQITALERCAENGADIVHARTAAILEQHGLLERRGGRCHHVTEAGWDWLRETDRLDTIEASVMDRIRSLSDSTMATELGFILKRVRAAKAGASNE